MIPSDVQHEIRNGIADISFGINRIEKAIVSNGIEIVSPVGHWNIRNDSEGGGGFTAKRGIRSHEKNDLLCIPGQEVVAPFDGIIRRYFNVYEDEPNYIGIEILSTGHHWLAQISYIIPFEEKVVGEVEKRQDIGYAADIRDRYNQRMKPHIDFRLTANPFLFREIEG
ncbi:unnamed protein product [marine sediment metagenome]|uniref:Peptidase M23 domain-containing protein n=1 Tax=marine sediment metagenome TaxID=412755 RepID=X0TP33_9ZZZZ